MKKPTVSVVIPCYNNERYIAEAIKSVRAQTFPVSEIIVVDNNCVDQTIAIAESLGAKIVRQVKQGISAARNAGMQASKGDRIAFLDADDYWLPNKIERQMQAAEMFPQGNLIVTDFRKVLIESSEQFESISVAHSMSLFKNEISLNAGVGYCPKFTARMFENFALLPSSLVMNRQVLEITGWFDENMLIEDIEYFARVLKDNSLIFVSENLVDYRFHQTNYSNNRKGFQGIVKMAEKTLKYPDNYVPDVGEVFRSFLKTHLANNMRNNVNSLLKKNN